MSENEEDVKKLEKIKKREEIHAELCQKGLEKVLTKSKRTRELLEKLERFDCELPPGMIKCDPCAETNEITGGYKPSYTDESGNVVEKSIVLCQMKLPPKDIEKVLKHELIHAFDDCTANLDWTNCAHHACSEIRASKLSGECTYLMEVGRGNFGILGYIKKCVKRRATLSVKMNPNCKEKAEEFVEQVWDACYHDTSPYSEN